ncbi:MAG: hypothetical protein ACE5Q6_19355 [Dehalococcoidia bacterium]
MARVSILEASRQLNLSQAEIRQYIREGKLTAVRDGGPQGRTWMVELPEEGWLDDDKAKYHSMAQQMTPWWWPYEGKSGYVHYVIDVGIEENLPEFLCGLVTDNIWAAWGYSEETCCPECLQAAREQDLPLWLE